VVGLQDEFYNQTIMHEELFQPILDIVIETMPRDNLLSSACLELFDFIKQQSIKPLIRHLVENYRERMKSITYVDTFKGFIARYDATQGFAPSMETSFLDTDEDTPKRPEAGRGTRWEPTGAKDLDAAEEEYFNTSDDDDEAQEQTPTKSAPSRAPMNGESPKSKPLVDYPSDEENENTDGDVPSGLSPSKGNTPDSSASKDLEKDRVLITTSSTAPSPPERLSEKRRREEDEDDELGKLSHHKRRSSSSSSGGSTGGNVLRRKKSFTNSGHGGPNSGGKPGKIAISLSPAIKTGGDNRGGDNTG
jgi:protein phosphatase 4 regulatory subunit 3